jgi:hypothetical protein
MAQQSETFDNRVSKHSPSVEREEGTSAPAKNVDDYELMCSSSVEIESNSQIQGVTRTLKNGV